MTIRLREFLERAERTADAKRIDNHLIDAMAKKLLPVRMLKECGLLFEINRTILNPLGLMLVLHRAAPGDTEVLAELHDVPGAGPYFPAEVVRDKTERFSQYLRSREDVRALRASMLGDAIQPVDGG